MALTIALTIMGVVVLTSLELWLFWSIGERDDRRPRLRHDPRWGTAARARPTALHSAGDDAPKAVVAVGPGTGSQAGAGGDA